MLDQYWTQREYAEWRRCSVRTLERERVAGTGCPYIRIGGRVFYRPADVRAFFEQHLRRSTSEAAA